MTNKDFQKIVVEYERLVYTICYQLIHSHEDAQNLTQETFVSAFLHIDTCRTDNYKAWIARIASNKARDFLKSAYNRREVQAEEYERADLKPLTEDRYIQKEAAEEARNEILNLKEPYKHVSVMYFLEEMSVDEISKKLVRPKKTVQTQLLRAKNILREKLKGEVL